MRDYVLIEMHQEFGFHPESSRKGPMDIFHLRHYPLHFLEEKKNKFWWCFRELSEEERNEKKIFWSHQNKR